MARLPQTQSIQFLKGKAGTAGINSNASFSVSLTPGIQGMGGMNSTTAGNRAARKAVLSTTLKYPGDDGLGNFRLHNGCDDYIWCVKPCTCTFALSAIVQTLGGANSTTSPQEFPGINEDLDDNINIDGNYPVIACNQIGDTNGDGLFDWLDVADIAELILLHDTEGYIPNENEAGMADLTGEGQISIHDMSLHIDCLINDDCNPPIEEETHVEVEQNSTGITVVEAAGSLGTFNVVYIELDCPANANVATQVLPTENCSASFVKYHIPDNPHYDANVNEGYANRSHLIMIICEPDEGQEEMCTFGNISSSNLQLRNFNTSNRSGLASTIENNTIINYNQSN